MSSYLDITRAAMVQALAYTQTDSVTYKEVTVNAAALEETSDTINFGGFEQHFKGTVYVVKDGFPEPVKGEKLELNGTMRRITGWVETPVNWGLHLEDISR
jgi:hypothetical protein